MKFYPNALIIFICITSFKNMNITLNGDKAVIHRHEYNLIDSFMLGHWTDDNDCPVSANAEICLVSDNQAGLHKEKYKNCIGLFNSEVNRLPMSASASSKNTLVPRRSARLLCKLKEKCDSPLQIQSKAIMKKDASTENKRSNKKIPVTIPDSKNILQVKTKTSSRTTLKYLKSRACNLKEQKFRNEDEQDIFSSSFGEKLKNSQLCDLLNTGDNDISEYVAIKTPEEKIVIAKKSITPRTRLLERWSRINNKCTISPSEICNSKEKKEDQQGALQVLYHHLKEKPGMVNKRKTFRKCKTNLEPKQSKDLNNSVLSILQQPQQDQNFDSSYDEYFE